jgi:hypothetical protein
MKRRFTRAKSKPSRPPTARKSSAKTRRRIAPAKRIILMVGTRKGAFIYYGDATRSRWRLDGPHRLGEIVNHVVLDPRDGNTMLMAARAGHLGPTIFRSTDMARTWKEAAEPPAFRKAATGENGRAQSSTRSGCRLRIAMSMTPGMRAPRRPRCFAAKTVELPGAASMATTTILCIQNGIRPAWELPTARFSVR